MKKSLRVYSYPKIFIVSYISYQFRGLSENSTGQVNQLRDIPSFYDVIGESVRKTTCNRYSLQLIVNIWGGGGGGYMLITCNVVGYSILYILSCARNTLTMKIKSYEIIMFEIYKYRIIFILTSFTSYLLFSFPSNMDICSKKVVVFSFFFFFHFFFCIAIKRPCDILQYITDVKMIIFRRKTEIVFLFLLQT